MHAQNDTKMHSDECKGRSLRFCVRAKQRVRFCVRAEQRVATIVGFRTLSSANVCSTNAFSFLCSPGWGQGEGLVRERVWDLRRKKKKKNGNEHHANSTAFLPLLFSSANSPLVKVKEAPREVLPKVSTRSTQQSQ